MIKKLLTLIIHQFKNDATLGLDASLSSAIALLQSILSASRLSPRCQRNAKATLPLLADACALAALAVAWDCIRWVCRGYGVALPW
jgi:hypothetical protein